MRYKKAPTPPGVWLLGVLAFALGFVALGFWVALIRDARATQTLTIVACVEETWEPGVSQDNCERPKSGSGSIWEVGEVVQVAGDICIEADRPVRFDVTVDWVSTTSTRRFRVFEFPTEWAPGCDPDQVYSFGYTVPDQLASLMEEGETGGRWKIVGRAVPQSIDFEEYEWDVTGAFELVPASG